MIPHRIANPLQKERGIALVAAVLVVLISSLVAATFMTTTTGERSLSSNVQVAKASLYAADAGVRTQQQVLANIAQAKLDSCCAAWSGTGPIITNPATLFPAGNIPAAWAAVATDPPFSANGSIVWQDSSITAQSQVYNYVFTISSSGNVRSTGLRRVQSQGLLRVSAQRGSFADYLLFTNQHTPPGGGSIWFTSSGNFDGRVHTNDEFRFAFRPTFHDLVTSVNTRAWYNNNGSPIELAANNNGSIDVPNFYGGFQRGVASEALPANTFNQQSAALGLSPSASSAPSNSTVNTQLGTGAGSGTPPNGIYVPNSGGSVTGGLYVQGTLDQCRIFCDTVTNVQYYRLVQGSTTKLIAINRTTNTTTVTVNAGLPVVYTGTPRGVMYVNGQISDIGGPDRSGGLPVPAVGQGTEMMIAAANDIIIQKDITYDDFNSASNVLGLFTAGGSIRVGTSAPNDCYLDAFVMATNSTNGAFQVDNYNSGSPRGTFHLRGGAITQFYGLFYQFNSSGVLTHGYGRDFHYDGRGLIPPYFPTTSHFNSDEPTARTLSWKEI